MVSRTDRRRRSNALAGALMVLAVLAPIAGLALGVWALSRPSAVAKVDRPVFVAVQKAEFLDTQQVSMLLTWTDGPSLAAPSWSGLVAEVAVGAGSVVTSGDRILRIDEVWRIAASTPAPFYRPVDEDSSKSEIADLNSLLASLGYPHGDGRWSRNTMRGVRGLAADIGVADSATLEAFDPAWTVWIPASSVVLADVTAKPGTLAPSPGEAFASTPPKATAVTIVAGEGQPAPPAPEEAGDWTVRAHGVELPYLGPESRDQDQLAPYSAAYASARPEEIKASIERVVPVVGFQVPTSSILVDAHTKTCVFRATSSHPDRGLEPVPVTVEKGTVGSARIRGELAEGDRVVVRVSAAVGRATCG